MSKQVAVSFEGGYVKVAYGSKKNGALTITRTLILEDAEFDIFLAREKIKDFVVVCSFQTFYQDVLFVPPTEEKYLRTILEAEIRKKAPELKDFVFFFTLIKERPHEGRPAKETFVFAADTAEVIPIIERFSRYGKRISHLYADVFALSRLTANEAGAAEKTVMGMADGTSHKTLFLMREGKLTFVRSIQSRGKGLDQYDVTNINMTVNYARQTLREHPEELVMVNTAKEKISAAEGLVLPASAFQYPPNIIIAEGDTTEFALPIAGLLLGKAGGKESLLPRAYKGLLLQERILRYASAAFIIISILCVGYMVAGWNQVYQMGKLMSPLKSEIAGRTGIYEEFESRNRELQGLMPYYNYFSGESATPNIQQPMIALQSLHRDKVRVKDIEIKNSGRELAVHIKGYIAVNTYGELQSRFRKLTEDIKAAEGVQSIAEKLDLANKDFSIELTWK